ncbi:hypothetical protein ACFWBI_15840 [Streptomyces sp. NPDC059982]|uniref:hypothetical protein n=1 Tax=unclassified Streptomyces TaxID=2593676 RepID=UPI0036C94F2D
MRAESPDGGGELLWHVLAKEPSSGTLCGRHAPPPVSTPAETGGATAERYCTHCMGAFRSAVQAHAEKELRPEAA